MARVRSAGAGRLRFRKFPPSVDAARAGSHSSPLPRRHACTWHPVTWTAFLPAADEEGASDGGDGGSSSGGEGGSGGGARQRQPKGFLEGGKADAFAKAFSKILDKAGAEKPGGSAPEAPILAVRRWMARGRTVPLGRA